MPPLSLQIWKHLFKSRKKSNSAAKLFAHASRTITCTAHTGSPKQDPPAIGRVQHNLHANFHNCLKQEKRKQARCACFTHDSVHFSYRISKLRPSSHWPCPTECSCQFSQLYKAGNTVTVLAKLDAHSSHAIARNAHTGSQNQDPPAVSHAQLTIHAKFHSCIRQETR